MCARAVHFLKMHNGHARPTNVFVSACTRESNRVTDDDVDVCVLCIVRVGAAQTVIRCGWRGATRCVRRSID